MMQHEHPAPAGTLPVEPKPLPVAPSEHAEHQSGLRNEGLAPAKDHTMPESNASVGNAHGGMGHDMNNPAMAANMEADIRLRF